MSTVEHADRKMVLPPLLPGQQLDQPTFHARYDAMPPATKAELVGGVVHKPSPMRRDHGDTSRIVAGLFFHYQWKTRGITGEDGATVKLNPEGEAKVSGTFTAKPLTRTERGIKSWSACGLLLAEQEIKVIGHQT
jgi:hypothetical protein